MLIQPRPILPLESLNDFQVTVLTRVADREDKTFIVMSGEPGAVDENDRNVLFNDFLRLIELGFFLELDRTDERYARMQVQFGQKGIALVIAEMTNRGQWMWETVKHDKWRN